MFPILRLVTVGARQDGLSLGDDSDRVVRIARYGTRTETTSERALSLGRRALSIALTAYR